ncbi:MAG: Kae1-associated serine/threonine protein kinase [Candidatus Aenigmarchaeota archaeon]|nr:Kae1-associated serine/threonine protein kinase [Candidatus Aenigmarchaeota archaeon]
MKIIQRGAEAIIYLYKNKIIKDRIKKNYRIERLDELIRKRRTKTEAKLLRDARSLGIPTPQIYETGKFRIEMEFINGYKVKDILNSADMKVRKHICGQIGRYVATLHSFDIVHGDLTTSNFILKKCAAKSELYLIDFGLGFYSKRIEDKATDAHLLYLALRSTHFSIFEHVWKLILNAYKRNYEDAEKIIKEAKKIEKRGRYR